MVVIVSTTVVIGYAREYSAGTAAAALQLRIRASARVVRDGGATDRGLLALEGCAGAPAIVDGAVFGMVTNCGVQEPTLIVPLSAAARWIRSNIPGDLTPLWRQTHVARRSGAKVSRRQEPAGPTETARTS